MQRLLQAPPEMLRQLGRTQIEQGFDSLKKMQEYASGQALLAVKAVSTSEAVTTPAHIMNIINPLGEWNYAVTTGSHDWSIGGASSSVGTAIDKLGVGQTLTDTITVYSKDGTAHDIVITIHSDNDRPYCSSEVQLNSGTEDAAMTLTTNQLLGNTIDVDANDAGQLTVQNLRADHGSILVNPDGTFTFTPAKDYNGPVYFSYDVADAHGGITHTGATTSLAAVADAADITGQDTGSITEDHHVLHDSIHGIQVMGCLTVSDADADADADAGQDHFQPTNPLVGNEKVISDPFQGELRIDRYGNWDYQLSNDNSEVQSLNEGETKDVIYEVHSADGTPHRITITVTGTNDLPMVSSAVTLASGTEDTVVTLQASDLLANAADVDHDA